MFVGEKSGDDGDSRPCWPWQPETESEPTEEQHDADVHAARDEQGLGDAESLGDGEESGALIEVDVLASVKNIEAADPKRHCAAENQHAPIEAAGDRNPRCCGRDAEGEAEKEVRPIGEALGEGIEEENCEGERREFECERIQLPRGDEEDCAGSQGEEPSELYGESACSE